MSNSFFGIFYIAKIYSQVEQYHWVQTLDSFSAKHTPTLADATPS
jgi:hypothetical protein